MTVDWPSVLPVWITLVLWSSTIILSTAFIVRRIVRMVIQDEMKESFGRLNAMALLIEEHYQRNVQQKETTNRNIQEVKARMEEVNQKVTRVPDDTADKVVEKIDPVVHPEGSGIFFRPH